MIFGRSVFRPWAFRLLSSPDIWSGKRYSARRTELRLNESFVAIIAIESKRSSRRQRLESTVHDKATKRHDRVRSSSS